LYTQGSQNGSEQVEAANMKHATNAVPMTAETFLLATRKVISQTFSFLIEVPEFRPKRFMWSWVARNTIHMASGVRRPHL
jgi:hypothetical protein